MLSLFPLPLWLSCLNPPALSIWGNPVRKAKGILFCSFPKGSSYHLAKAIAEHTKGGGQRRILDLCFKNIIGSKLVWSFLCKRHNQNRYIFIILASDPEKNRETTGHSTICDTVGCPDGWQVLRQGTWAQGGWERHSRWRKSHRTALTWTVTQEQR